MNRLTIYLKGDNNQVILVDVWTSSEPIRTLDIGDVVRVNGLQIATFPARTGHYEVQ